MDPNESLVCESQPPVPEGDWVLVYAWAWVAGGDGELGGQVAGVEGRQLLQEGHHHDPTVGGHALNLRVELDVVHNLKNTANSCTNNLCKIETICFLWSSNDIFQ